MIPRFKAGEKGTTRLSPFSVIRRFWSRDRENKTGRSPDKEVHRIWNSHSLLSVGRACWNGTKRLFRRRWCWCWCFPFSSVSFRWTASRWCLRWKTAINSSSGAQAMSLSGAMWSSWTATPAMAAPGQACHRQRRRHHLHRLCHRSGRGQWKGAGRGLHRRADLSGL